MCSLPKFISEQGLEFQLNLKKLKISHQWFNDVTKVRKGPLVIPDLAKASTELHAV